MSGIPYPRFPFLEFFHSCSRSFRFDLERSAGSERPQLFDAGRKFKPPGAEKDTANMDLPAFRGMEWWHRALKQTIEGELLGQVKSNAGGLVAQRRQQSNHRVDGMGESVGDGDDEVDKSFSLHQTVPGSVGLLGGVQAELNANVIRSEDLNHARRDIQSVKVDIASPLRARILPGGMQLFEDFLAIPKDLSVGPLHLRGCLARADHILALGWVERWNGSVTASEGKLGQQDHDARGGTRLHGLLNSV